ncbi:MAG: hypothetical protein ACAH83_03625 [Alphaproteobacteria bacterium]
MKVNISPFRLVLGFLIGPITPGILVTFIALAIGHFRYDDIDLKILGLAALLGYPVALLVGLPVYIFIFRRFNYHRFWAYAVAGALLGAIDYLVYLGAELAGGNFSTLGTAFNILPLGMVSGLIAGITFWLLVVPEWDSEEE